MSSEAAAVTDHVADHALQCTLPDGRVLGYQIEGEGEITVVLLHGVAMCRAFFVPIVQSTSKIDLEKRVRFVLVDRPGWFESSDPPKGYSYTKFAADIEALMDHVGAAKFCVLGHSSGGPCALAVAAALPSRVLACTIVGPDAEYTRAGAPVDPFALGPLTCCWFLCCVANLGLCCSCLCAEEASKAERGDFSSCTGIFVEAERALYAANGGDNAFRAGIDVSAHLASEATKARVGVGGFLNDWRLERSSYSFDTSAAQCPVHIFVGAADKLTRKNAEFINKVVMPASTLTVFEGDVGHFNCFSKAYWLEMLDATLAKK